jgi:hypothetical protein
MEQKKISFSHQQATPKEKPLGKSLPKARRQGNPKYNAHVLFSVTDWFAGKRPVLPLKAARTAFVKANG